MSQRKRERGRTINGETSSPSRVAVADVALPVHSRLGESDDRSLQQQQKEQTSEALADAFSSTLASIATKRQETGAGISVLDQKLPPRTSSTATTSDRKLPAAWARQEARSSSEEGGVESSSGSSRKNWKSSAAIVTANTTTTSSSEDRDSSGHTASHNRSSGTDGCGLPVPKDDNNLARGEGGRCSTEQHATVVAHHLPPPDTTNATTSSSGSGGESGDRDEHKRGSLLQPHHEPGFHTIRRTFNKFLRNENNTNAANRSSETDSSGDAAARSRLRLRQNKRQATATAAPDIDPNNKDATAAPQRKRPRTGLAEADEGGGSNDENGGGSSGSGTEGGYDGSASSSENARVGSCSSPSVSSSDASVSARKPHHAKGKTALSGDPNRPMLSKKKQVSSLSVSSEIADFGSSSSESAAESFPMHAFRDEDSPSISSSSNDEREDPVSAPVRSASRRNRVHVTFNSKPAAKSRSLLKSAPGGRASKTPIMTVGSDVMAHILTFLEPPDILPVLTAPLSKDWLNTFTRQPELWRVLCLLDPFKAKVDDDDDSSGEDSDDSFSPHPHDVDAELRRTFGKFRLMYTSFVRCMRYLARIKDDATHGRPPSVSEYATVAAKVPPSHNIAANRNLQMFLARARGVVMPAVPPVAAAAAAAAAPANNGAASSSSDEEGGEGEDGAVARRLAHDEPIGISDDGSSTSPPPRKRKSRGGSKQKPKKLRFGHSKLTQRLLGPTREGLPGEVDLPWSCAIYSIVNWMMAFADVEGIQTMCLKVLPLILENEQQRITAQRAGLTEMVLRSMVMFADSAQLHTAAFHTIVLLARPLGGQEGMLFHSSMVNASGIFEAPDRPQSGKNGIAVMLDSMKRFPNNEVLQAMSCWSLVNIALAPAQKEVLVKLGGIEATANAMMRHPHNAEVQFRGLFALINLVIPSVRLTANEANRANNQAEGNVEDAEVSSEKEMLDEMVDHIVSLVVLAMKNFCSSEAILNRACLVLHNLSLTPDYHGALLWTPNCYQMLDWCLANYRTDQVLQQSAAGTLHRLQMTLSSDERLRARFAASLQAQQQLSLEQAHREAVYLRDQQEHVARQLQQQQQPQP